MISEINEIIEYISESYQEYIGVGRVSPGQSQANTFNSRKTFYRHKQRQIPIQVLGGNAPKPFEYVFQAAVQTIDRIKMVDFAIVCMAVQNNLNTLLFSNQVIIRCCTITLKNTAL